MANLRSTPTTRGGTLGQRALALLLRVEHVNAGVQISESIQCPFCGQAFDLVIDTSVSEQRFTTDCEVCCRPFEVLAECEPGEILSLEVQGN